MIRSAVTAGLSLSVAATGLLLVSPSQANLSAAGGGGTTNTHFAMQASGYSTRVVGGGVPVNSDRTAFQAIGCTNKAGISKMNEQAGLDLSPLLTVSAAKTTVKTTSKNGVVASWARNRIARVTIGPDTPASPTISGITSTSRAYHNASGFHASTKTRVLEIDIDGPLIPGGIVDGPTAGNPVVIPGVASIAVGPSKRTQDAHSASAKADALVITLIPTNTVVHLAHSQARIDDGVVSGLFRGSAFAAQATALDDALSVGKTPLILMPCQGTNGKVIRKDIARVNVLGAVLKGLHADQSADQTKSRADGYERGRVARLRLGNSNDTLVVRGIVGKANVHYVRGKGTSFDTKGSGLLGVRVNGEPQSFGSDGVIRIAGLVKLENHIVKRTKTTIQVTELRLTLLGSDRGAQIDLGVAKVGFRKVNF